MNTAERKVNVLDSESIGELRDLLKDLLHLLEEYGPVWCSEELHERLVAAVEKTRTDLDYTYLQSNKPG